MIISIFLSPGLTVIALTTFSLTVYPSISGDVTALKVASFGFQAFQVVVLPSFVPSLVKPTASL